MSLYSRYRATGADLPFGDPLTAHDVAMEGYFWRFTDPASGLTYVAVSYPVDHDGDPATPELETGVGAAMLARANALATAADLP